MHLHAYGRPFQLGKVHAFAYNFAVKRADPSPTAVRAWARLIKARTKLVDAVEKDLKAAGLPPLAWYDVLLEVHRAGAAGARPNELQRSLLIAQHNFSRLVDRLEDAGYVTRRPLPDDRRAQCIKLNPSGRTLLRKMWPVYAAAIQKHFAAKLPGKDAERLAAMLQVLLAE